MKIALDAMGGDHAPGVNIMGARDALTLYPGIESLFLVGDKATLERECRQHELTDSRMEIVHAPDVIGMSESAITGIRRCPPRDTSLPRIVQCIVTTLSASPVLMQVPSPQARSQKV